MTGLSKSITDALIEAGIVSNAADIQSSRGDRVTRKSDGATYFVKEGSNVKQMLGEAASLRAMDKACPGICPRVHYCEQKGGKAIMISDYFDLQGASSSSQRILGKRMAEEMHNPDNKAALSPSGKYGFAGVPTHCGDTEQDNTDCDTWLEFFRDKRLGVLIKSLGKQDPQMAKAGKDILERVCPLLLESFDPPAQPVILHGDLWSGNVSSIEGGQPVIYDPSSAYGHGESDWGIANMFGGLSAAQEAYFQVRTKSQPHFEQRMRLYELYHHLNHASLFGSGYARGALSIMQELSAWADDQGRR